MSHVDNGALHAYLDGALDEYPVSEANRIRDHLDACAECAARLVEERRIRSDASAMLGLAVPDIEMPSLEELRAYVKATRVTARPAAARLYRMGWAASVVLAVGAGWMVRDGQLQTPVLERANAQAGVTAEDLGSAPDVPMESVGRAMSVATSDEAGAGGSASQVFANRDVSRTEAAAPKAAEPAPGRLLSPAMMAANEENRASADRSRAVASDAEAEAFGRASGVVDSMLREVDDAVTAGMDVEAVASEVDRVEAAADVPSDLGVAQTVDSLQEAERLDEAVAGPEEMDKDEELVARRRAESPVPMMFQFNNAPASVRQGEFESAESFDRQPALVVQGYEVISVTSLGESTEPIGVQVVQRIQGDTTVEIFHLEPGVSPAVLPALPSGRNEYRAETPGGWIVMRGALTRVQFEVLLVSLFPTGE